jgi:hypothetical protein
MNMMYLSCCCIFIFMSGTSKSDVKINDSLPNKYIKYIYTPENRGVFTKTPIYINIFLYIQLFRAFLGELVYMGVLVIGLMGIFTLWAIRKGFSRVYLGVLKNLIVHRSSPGELSLSPLMEEL